MNQLDKLIEQYERENPENLARNSYYCLATNKYIEFYTDKFIKWQLATRPTCGKEQRKFLDEVETNYSDYLAILSKQRGIDLEKVIKGE